MTEFSFDLYSMPVSLYVAFLSKQQPHNTGKFWLFTRCDCACLIYISRVFSVDPCYKLGFIPECKA